jgi:hypothetical protein
MDAVVWVSVASLVAALVALATAGASLLVTHREYERLRELYRLEVDKRELETQYDKLFVSVYAVERAIQAAHEIADRDLDQSWYWTPEWQAGERDADADIAAGRTTVYDSEEEFFAALDHIPAEDEAAAGPRP